jgi:O-methyltransferase domain/Dimerisation domain
MVESRAPVGRTATAANRRKALTDIAKGYMRSRALGAAARLGVADALGHAERSVDEVAAACSARPDSLYRLLRALASFGVVAETTPNHFVLTPFGEPLRKEAPHSEWAQIIFWADLLADNWSCLTDCVRTGDKAMLVMEREGVVSRWSKDPNSPQIFRAVMGTAPAEDYMLIARAWDFAAHQTVADLGGGGGALLAAILTTHPHLRGMLVDRPESVAQARARFESEGLDARCRFEAADLLATVPSGADVYVLKHVLHGYQDDPAGKILRNCLAALPKEGRVLLAEFVLPDVVALPDREVERRLMSDLNMLTASGGKERSAAEWKKLLENAGFDCRGVIPIPGELVSIIEASPRA